MSQAILVINAGSSSIKFRLYLDGPSPKLMARGLMESIGRAPHFRAEDAEGQCLIEKDWPPAAGHDVLMGFLMEWVVSLLGPIPLLAVGHRVVHGGSEFITPVRVDEGILQRLEALVPLAPLHQPHNLLPIRSLLHSRPDLPQVACFDTTFHRGHPDVADIFALPPEFVEKGLRRYGFHGLSYEYIMSELPKFAPDLAGGRIVIAHLGNGASMCAVSGGKSIESTMGFTALEGLVMGTRCGAIDPGAVLHLILREGYSAAEVEHLLYHESGLLGVSGLSGDMRDLLASDTEAARLAIRLYVYRITQSLGALAAVLGGIDALIFTAGIGENAAPIRAEVCNAAAWLGLQLDDKANNAGNSRISLPQSRVSAWVIPTNEELMIARHTKELLQ